MNDDELLPEVCPVVPPGAQEFYDEIMGYALWAVGAGFLAALAVFFTTVVGALLGFKAADKASLDVVSVYGGGRFTQLRKVRLVAAVHGVSGSANQLAGQVGGAPWQVERAQPGTVSDRQDDQEKRRRDSRRSPHRATSHVAAAQDVEAVRGQQREREDEQDDAVLVEQDEVDTLLAEAEREEKASDELEQEFSYQALGSVAHFDRVLYDGKEFGQLAVPGTPEEEEFLGLPGLLEPEHVHELLMQRQSRQSRHRRSREAREGAAADAGGTDAGATTLPPALHRTLREQRQLLNSLVGLYARQSGEPHGAVHAELRRVCGGPAVAQATVTQLQSRIDILRSRVRS